MCYCWSNDIYNIDSINQFIYGIITFDLHIGRHLSRSCDILIIKANKLIISNLFYTINMYFPQMSGT